MTRPADRHATSTRRRILWIALIVTCLLATANSLITPPFEPPDELQHYQFVRHLVDEGRLPVQDLNAEISQSHQPPLYYLVGALLVSGIDDPETGPARNDFWNYQEAPGIGRDNKLQFLPDADWAFPYHGTALVVHVLRFWSVALTLGTVIALWAFASTLWPYEPAKVAALLAFSVLNPMVLYLAGSVNNDNLIILCGALILWLSLRGAENSFTWDTTLLLGLVWGVSILSKLTGIVLVVPWLFALAWMALQSRRPHLFVSRLAAILAIAMSLSGWWFLRNLRLYGTLFGLERMLTIWGGRESFDILWILNDLVYYWTTFWGRFGYGQIPLPRLIYWLFFGLVIFAVAGLVRRWIQALREPDWSPARWRNWYLFLVTGLAFGIAVLYYILQSSTGANGRYAFPALGALSALLIQGLSSWFIPRRRPAALFALVGSMAAIAVFTGGFFLPWTYAPPRLVTMDQALNQVNTPSTVVWRQSIALVGTTLIPQEAGPGEQISLTACWRAEAPMTENYVIYVHLLDKGFDALGSRHTHPGLGTFPTSLWKPGDIFCDTYHVPITRDPLLPTVADVRIGFYDAEAKADLPARNDQGDGIDYMVVGQVKVTPGSPPEAPEPDHPLRARFEQGVTLTGYSWSDEEVRAGEIVSVTLSWTATGPLDRSYTIFAQLLDTAGELVTQDDGPPRDGDYPTLFWGSGDLIVDERVFSIPARTNPGTTTLLVGLYRLEDGHRLPRVDSLDLPDAVGIPGPTVSLWHDDE